MRRKHRATRNLGSMGCSACFRRGSAGNAEDTLPNVPDWDEHHALVGGEGNSGILYHRAPAGEIWRTNCRIWTRSGSEEICAMKQSTGKDETITTAGIISNLRVRSRRRESCMRGLRWRT